MESIREGEVILVRFADGEDLLEGLKQVLVAEGVHAGVVLGGVGMLSSPGIAFYKGDGKYDPIPLREEVEICALNGNVATVEGEVFIHLHATLGTSTGQAFAGHFTGGKVHMTAEVAVRALRARMVRELDSKLGLKTLRFGPSTKRGGEAA